MTFVGVHGAWGGACGFRTARRLLQACGHEVLTPSRTGHPGPERRDVRRLGSQGALVRRVALPRSPQQLAALLAPQAP